MKFISTKILCFIIALTMIFSAAAEAADITSATTSLNIDDNGNISMIVNKTSEDSGKGIVAIYNKKGQLKKVVTSEEVSGSGKKTLSFNEALTKDENSIVKAFLWKSQDGKVTLEPLSDAFTPAGQPTIEPIPTSSPKPSNTPTATDKPITDGYKATFVTDAHASITVSDTQDFTDAAENVTEAYARNSDTGEIDTTGDGQVNFKVIVEDGYEVDTVTVSPSNYKNLKLPSELGESTYRITKVTGDITVTAITKEAAEPTPTPTTDPNATPIPGDGIIYLLGDSINAEGVENVTVDGTTATITAAGEYTIEGTLNDGQIAVALASNTEEAVINLNGVNITSATGSPFAATEGKVEVSAKKGTVNTLKSTAVYTETEEKTPNACLYSRRDLKIKGSGTLIVESSFNNGVGTRGDLTIQKATVNITSTANHGIKGSDSVTVISGTITSEAVGDALKSDEIIDIQGGTLNLTSGDEGIQAGESETDETTGETVITNGVITISEETAEKTDVTIKSEGDGINSTEGDVTVNGGTITINSQQDCIQADNTTNISGGTFDLTAYGGAPQTVSANNAESANSCKGIKAGKLVYISGGQFNINTYDDAVHSNHTARILGGNMNIATGDDGVHGDSYLYISDNANINITKSYEGIEAAEIYVSGGETRVVSSDDGANAAGDEPADSAYDIDNVPDVTAQSLSDNSAENNIQTFAGPGGNQGSWGGGPNWGGEDTSSYGYLEVSGGLLYIEAEGDGFDSNGSGLISGGTVLVNGPTSGGNGVFDIGDNSSDTLTITGGIVIGAGTSDMAVTPDSAKQYYVVTSSGSSSGSMGGFPGQSTGSSGFSSQSAGKAFNLTNSIGDEIVTYVPSKTYAWVFVSTPEMTSGSYTLNYGGSVSGGTFTGKGSYGIVTGGTYQGSSSCSLTAVSK